MLTFAFEKFEMQYKLICTDIDGTLLNKDRELSETTIKVVQKIAPIPFVLISSRMPKAIRHLQHQFNNINTPIIAYNGGLVLDGDTILHSSVIDNTILSAIINESETINIHLSLFYTDEWYVPTMDYWAKREQNNTKVTPIIKSPTEVLAKWKQEEKGAHKIMCMGEEQEIAVLYKTLEEKFSEEIILYRSKPTYIEISHRSVSKKTAIAHLLKYKYPSVTFKNVVAFGDNYNDIEMLKAVGLGVAVANANTEVLSIADLITETNKNDGVAKTIKALF